MVAIKSIKPDKGKKIVIRYIPIVIGINPKGFLSESNKISSSSVSVREVNFFEKEEDGLSFYHMEGNVSTENNGGFIQFRAEVKIEDKNYQGLKIKTRGNGEEYYLFIRTTKTRLPWLYYGSSFSTTDQWQWIEIPFSSFKKSEGRFSGFLPKKFDIEGIKSIGIVAYGKDFYADIDVAGLELY